MLKGKLIILFAAFVVMGGPLKAQELQMPTWQTFTYTNEPGYTVEDISWVNNHLVTCGSFKNNGSHPIATLFNNKGEFVRDMYWSNLNGVLDHSSVINDTCLLFYGGHYYASTSTLSNSNLIQRDPSFHVEGQQNVNNEQLVCFYRGNKMVNVFKDDYVHGIKIIVQENGKESVTTTLEISKNLFYVKGYVSDSKNSLYIITYSGGDSHFENVYQVDITDLAKPVLKAKTLSSIWFRDNDLVTDITDESFTIIYNAYLTSASDAEAKTYTTEIGIGMYKNNNGYIEQVSQKITPSEGRGAEFMGKLSEGRYVKVWVGYTGIYVEIDDSQMEIVNSFSIDFGTDYVSRYTYDYKKVVVKVFDSNTIGVLFPYGHTDDKKTTINTWDLYTYKIK